MHLTSLLLHASCAIVGWISSIRAGAQLVRVADQPNVDIVIEITVYVLVTVLTNASFHPTEQLGVVQPRLLVADALVIFANGVRTESVTLHVVSAIIVISCNYYTNRKHVTLVRIIFSTNSKPIDRLPFSHFLLSFEATVSRLQFHTPFRHTELSMTVSFFVGSHRSPSSARRNFPSI